MKYLFIDRKHVQMIDGIRQVFHQPANAELDQLASDLISIDIFEIIENIRIQK